MSWGPRKLFARYAAALMGFTAIVVVATGAIYLGVLYREVREAASEVQRAEARVAAARIEQFLGRIRATAAETASLPWAAGVLAARDRREEYHRLMKLLPAVSEIAWVDDAGRERLRVSRFQMDTRDRFVPVLPAEDVKAARKQGVLYGKPFFRDGSEPFATMAVASPADPDGVLVALIDLKFVTDVVRQIRPTNGGNIYVAGADDRLIAHPNLNLVLRQTSLSGYEPLRQLREALKAAHDEPVGMFEGRGLEAGDVLLSAASIPSASWVVVMEQPKAQVLAPVYDALRNTALIVLASLVAALLVSYALARRLATPILELRRGAARIAAGELDARIDLKAEEEIEAVAHEFNHMAAQLQEYTAGLERKVQEKTADLQAALSVAHDAMRARAVFLAAASHDLRQPLYAISILADTLSMEALPPAAAAVLEKQIQAIAVLRTLFDNLLDLSRFDAGEIHPVLRVVGLREILEPVATEHEVLCRAKGLRWNHSIDEATIETDPQLLRRLVGNLLANAVRYTEAGGEVSLRAIAESPQVSISVSDTGIGIARQDQARVFDEFVQLGNPSRDREKGVGLGLSIVKRICGLLRIDLELESSPGTGTTFRFAIPLSHSQTAPAQGLFSLDTIPTEQLAGLRLWIAEDDAMVRDALAAQCNAWGVIHGFAANRAQMEELRRSEGEWPDAAMLDDMLESGERGLDLARWLEGHMSRDRIVFVTGNVDRERLRLLLESGFRVFSKPLAPHTLARWLAESRHGAARPTPVAAP